jgi:hypothetical protein
MTAIDPRTNAIAAATLDSPSLISSSAVSWAAILAGAFAATALTLFLFALGVGLGLSSVSPWSGSGVGATTFKVGAGLYMVATASIASAIGGHIAGRLRTRWAGLLSDEVFFRDTAHGFTAWAFATVLTFAALGTVTTHLAAGVSSGAVQAAGTAASGPMDLYADELLRPSPGATRQLDPAARGEISRLLANSFAAGDVGAPDRTYLGQVVAANTGLAQPEADRRVNEVIVRAKDALDKARKAAAQFAFWLAASLLMGAFAASWAATEGGEVRDRY